MRPKFKQRIALLFIFTGACSLLGFTWGWLGQYHWFLDLFAHFRWQYAAGLALAAWGLLIFKRRKCALLVALMAMALFSTTLPLKRLSTQGNAFRVVSYNVLTENLHKDKVLHYLLNCEADLIFLMEVDQAWVNHLKPLKQHYPHSVEHPMLDNFGVALYSKHPFSTQKTYYWGKARRPSLLVQLALPHVELDSKLITFIGTHPPPPVGKAYSNYRNTLFEDLAIFLKTYRFENLIVAGDLNCTPWSFHFKQWIERTHLHNTADYNWIGPTWNVWNFLAIPIDHVLFQGNLAPVSAQTDPTLGSDHAPVVVDFARLMQAP